MPSSYQAPMRGDKADQKSASQSVDSVLSTASTKVSALLERKGREVFTVAPHETLENAVKILRDKGIGALVVCDADGALLGILSERDIVRKLAETPGKTLPQSVAENMTRDVVTCGKDDTVDTILHRMNKGRFRHMPVVEAGRLCGLVTIGDVVNYRINELELEALRMKQLIVG